MFCRCNFMNSDAAEGIKIGFVFECVDDANYKVISVTLVVLMIVTNWN